MANLTSGQPLIDPNPPGAPRRLFGADGSGGTILDNPFLPYITNGLLVAQHTAGGITPVFQAAAGAGERYTNTGRETLLVLNASGAPVTVTIIAQTRCNVGPGYLHDIVTVVPSGTTPAVIGPASFQFYNDINGQAWVAYSSAGGVSVALIFA